MLIDVSPSILTPLLGIRSADFDLIAEYRSQLASGWKPEPIRCFEHSGYFLIVDGHHRWAAHVMQGKLADIRIDLIDGAELSSSTPFHPDTIEQEVNWSTVYDWEAALDVRLLNGAFDECQKYTPLTILSGPSGVGKSQIIQELKRQGIRLAPMRTVTTRAKRNNEVEGVDYDFVSETKFHEFAKTREFIEWQNIHGRLYGSLWDIFFPQSPQGLRIKDLDAYGTLQIKSLYPNVVRTMFVEVSSFSELRNRIMGRGADTQASAIYRLTRARKEMQLRYLFDHRVLNDSLEFAAQEVLLTAQRRIEHHFPCPFFADKQDTGQYVALQIEVGTGQALAWANLREKICPVLRLNTAVPQSIGFRLLEAIVIDQLTDQLRPEEAGGELIRALVHELENAKVTALTDVGASKSTMVAVKIVRVPLLQRAIAHWSKFFTLQPELWPSFALVRRR